MNATHQAALTQGLALHDQMLDVVDKRTLAILDRRRRTATIKRRGWLIRRMLLLADVLGLTVAFVVAASLFDGTTAADHIPHPAELVLFLLTLPGWIIVAKLKRLYDHDEERTDHTTPDDLAGVFSLVTIGSWLFFAGAWLTGLGAPTPAKLLTFWALAIALVALGRVLARFYCRRHIAYLQNTVIVGAGEIGQLIAAKFLQHPEYGINLVGFVDSAPRDRREDLEHVPVLGPPERLPGIVRLLDVERVVLAFSSESHEQELELIRSLKDLDVQVDVVPRLFEVVGRNVGMHSVEGIPLVGLPAARLSHSSRLLKRLMDVLVSSLALAVLSPLFLFIAWRIKAESPGPVYFRQVRMGSGDKTFRIYKFRTMVADADERKHEVAHLNMHERNGGDPRMFKVPDDPRVTRFGSFLRRYSLDELPQLINVLKGEMTLVGPRPLILIEDQYIVRWARRRLELKPGMTGLWQVLGGSEIPFEEMTRLDYIYVTNWSLSEDLRLLLQTIPALMRTRAAY